MADKPRNELVLIEELSFLLFAGGNFDSHQIDLLTRYCHQQGEPGPGEEGFNDVLPDLVEKVRSNTTIENSVVNAGVLAEAVEALREHEREAAISQHHTGETADLIKKLVKLRQKQILREKIILNAQANLDARDVKDTSDPKGNLSEDLINTATYIVQSAAAVADIVLTDDQLNEKVVQLVDIVQDTDNFDITKTDKKDLAIALDLILQPEDSPITALYQEIVNNTHEAKTIDDYLENTLYLDPQTNHITRVDKIQVPTELTPLSIVIIEQVRQQQGPVFDDRVDKIQQSSNTLQEAYQNAKGSQEVIKALSYSLTDAQVNLIIEAARQISPELVQPQTESSAKLEGFLKAAPALTNPAITPAAVKLLGVGLDSERLEAIRIKSASSPNSLAYKVFHNPTFLRSKFVDQVRQIENLPPTAPYVGVPTEKQPAPPPVKYRTLKQDLMRTGVPNQYQQFVNRFSNAIPNPFVRQINIILNPVSSIVNWSARRTGTYIANQITSRVTNVAIKKAIGKAAEFIFSKGVNEGLKQLITKIATTAAIKAGLITVAQAANVIPGLGIAIGVVIAIGGFILEKMAKEPEKVIGVPIAIVGGMFSGVGAGVGGVVQGVAGTVTAGVAVVASVLGTVAAGAAVALVLYLTAFTAGPLVASLAQLSTGLGIQQGAGGPITAPYTGPIIPGCPGSWPMDRGLIIQGPHAQCSHALVGAVDILAPVGTPVKAISYGTVIAAGWANESPVYGNWVQIRSTTTNGQSYIVLYGHLSIVNVVSGQNVKPGDIVAHSGATSSVVGFANPHLHLEYRGIDYNACPAGGVQIPEGCYGTTASGTTTCPFNGSTLNSCLINGSAITIP